MLHQKAIVLNFPGIICKVIIKGNNKGISWDNLKRFEFTFDFPKIWI